MNQSVSENRINNVDQLCYDYENLRLHSQQERGSDILNDTHAVLLKVEDGMETMNIKSNYQITRHSDYDLINRPSNVSN